ncbi:NAD(P)-binding protein [Bimuria novae-zelandiae CBS 107.79]|uniref:NAD(P)-binding protein n=1 Tax=Bimuria novae-zelandiae CBS 107.79 TaxID=1447943 RepID=A0A6A5V895_9PLEO|nr:NAD(P)-binding protein [Bimuria novae-zelandiae CBS 107.79]
MPSVEFLRDIVVLDNAKTRPYRAAVERRKVDEILLETYTRHWYARDWLSKPPVTSNATGGTGQLPKRDPLYEKVAIVIGASSGIGAATATALAREGSRGPRCLTSRCSRGSEEAHRRSRRSETARWRSTPKASCLSFTVPFLLSCWKGHIVAISSDAGRKVFPGLGVYSARKFFVEATLQALRLETSGSGLRVSSFQPGNVATDLLGMSTDAEALKKYGEPSGDKVLDPEDVANAIVYALTQPEHVAVNEILTEHRDEPI